MFVSIGSTALSGAKLEFEIRFMKNTDEKIFQELQHENYKLTLTNREKGVVLLDLRATLEPYLMDINGWKDSKEKLCK